MEKGKKKRGHREPPLMLCRKALPPLAFRPKKEGGKKKKKKGRTKGSGASSSTLRWRPVGRPREKREKKKKEGKKTESPVPRLCWLRHHSLSIQWEGRKKKKEKGEPRTKVRLLLMKKTSHPAMSRAARKEREKEEEKKGREVHARPLIYIAFRVEKRQGATLEGPYAPRGKKEKEKKKKKGQTAQT